MTGGGGLSRDGLLRHSMILLVAQQFGNVANMGFQAVTSRLLKGGPEYAILVSLLSTILIASAPMQALRTLIAYYTSHLIQTGRLGEVPGLLRRWAVRLLWLGALLLVVTAVGEPLAMEFLHIEQSGPVLAMAMVLALMFFMTMTMGALQGLQSFRWMGGLQIGWSLTRFGCAAIFLGMIARTASWGLIAQVVATLAVVIAAWAVIRNALRDVEHAERSMPSSAPYFFRTCLMLISFAVLMNADMVLVRHFLPEASGSFARAATIGRIVIFLPMPVAMAMFPKVTSGGGDVAADRGTLLRGLAFSVVIIAVAAGACVVLPWLPVWVIHGREAATPEVLRLVRWVVIALSPLSLCFLLMNFELAQHRFRTLPGGVLMAAAYLVGVGLFHQTVWQVVVALAATSTGFLLILGVGIHFGLSARGKEAS